MKPLVSVILPAYNSSKYITYTINSLLNQTYDNIEIIVINDGSKDDTEKIVTSYTDSRIKYFANDSNYGLSYSTNRGLSLAKGEFIAHADHDDISTPFRIKRQVEYLQKNTDITGVSTSVIHINSKITAPKNCIDEDLIVTSNPTEVNFESMWGGILSNPTLLYRKSILDNMPSWFDEKMKVSADMDFFEKTFKAGAKWVTVKNKLLQYRRHQSNTSRNLTELKIIEKHNVLKESTKRLINDVSSEELNLHVKIACRLDVLNTEERTNTLKWFEKLITQFKSDEETYRIWLKCLAHKWTYACALSNIYSPFNGYKMYKSIPELMPYLKNKKYFYEWQKRFFRALSWKIEGKN